jgi:RNA polymerase sigma-70 factor (ECF subfamily)
MDGNLGVWEAERHGSAGYMGEADVQLMCRVREGDAHSYGALWERHRKPLVGYLRRIVVHEFVAEELAQDVFLRVYRSREHYQPNAKFSTWLFRIASHVAINWLRDFRYEKQRESIEAAWMDSPVLHLPDQRPNVEQMLLAIATSREIRNAIQKLPLNQGKAVILHKYRELDYAQIARILDCSESAVKSLLFRAYERLRSNLAHFDPTV